MNHEQDRQPLRPLRILFTGFNIAPLARPLRWALQRGHQVWYIGNAHPFPSYAAPNFRFIPAAYLTRPDHIRLENLTKNRELFARFAPAEIDLLLSTVEKFQPDIVHAFGMDFLAECCARANLKPLVVSAWGYLNNLLENPDGEVHLPDRLRFILERVAVLLIASPTQMQFVDRLPGFKGRAEKLVLGVDVNNFRPGHAQNLERWRKSLGLPTESALLFSARGWGNIYNQNLILEAFATAVPHLGLPVTLAFLQLKRSDTRTVSNLFSHVKQLSKNLGISSSVNWLSEIPHDMMPPIFALADRIISYPSTDAFPITLLEAVACERPVISADLPAYRDTYIKEFCLLVEPNNPQALAEAVIDSFRNPPDPELLRRGREFVVANYNEDKAKQTLFDLYESLAS